jgi:hypothetical protein
MLLHAHPRLKAIVSATKPTGATPAIQSQCTERPKMGLIVALRMMDTPTITVAQTSETTQLLGTPLPRLSGVFSVCLVCLAIRETSFSYGEITGRFEI